jgi:hypothetical protein
MKKALVLFLMAAALSSCATTTPITNPSERISKRGFSLLPPQEPGWTIWQQSRGSINLGKTGGTRDESYVAFVELFEDIQLEKIPGQDEAEKLRHVGKIRGFLEFSTDRFKMLEMSDGIYGERKETCAVSFALVVDLQARKQTGNPEIMLMKSYDIYCMHPYLKSTLMRLGYSHRYYRKNEDKGFVERATSFINNVVFVEP